MSWFYKGQFLLKNFCGCVATTVLLVQIIHKGEIMFISNEEKLRIASELDLASNQIATLRIMASSLEKRVEELEKKAVQTKPHKLTEEELKAEMRKARQRAYGRAYYQRKQQEKQVLNVGS